MLDSGTAGHESGSLDRLAARVRTQPQTLERPADSSGAGRCDVSAADGIRKRAGKTIRFFLSGLFAALETGRGNWREADRECRDTATMGTNTVRASKNSSTRRSQRLLLNMAVIVAGERSDGNRFAEQTTTAVVNAHGAMVLLKELVYDQQMLRIRNVKTGEEQPCKVVDLGGKADGKTEVGIEFLAPSPRFWRIAFPPEDWNLNSPEAKRSGRQPVADPKSKASQ